MLTLESFDLDGLQLFVRGGKKVRGRSPKDKVRQMEGWMVTTRPCRYEPLYL